MTQAILVALFCCQPTGIAAIVHASKVASLQAGGDIAGAQHASEQAQRWIKISVRAGAAWVALWFIIGIIGGL